MAGRFPLYTDADVRVWRQAVYGQMTDGELVEVFEELARQDDPFALYPIVRIWPKP